MATGKMEQGIAAEVRSLAEPVITAHGLELILVEFVTQRGRPILRLYIDRPLVQMQKNAPEASSGVTVEDCIAVSRELGAILDVEDVIAGSYELEVSSPGLNRPLVHLDHFRSFVGAKVKLKTDESVNGRKNFKGRLAGVEGEDILIEDETGRIWRIPHGTIVKANVEYEFDSGA